MNAVVLFTIVVFTCTQHLAQVVCDDCVSAKDLAQLRAYVDGQLVEATETIRQQGDTIKQQGDTIQHLQQQISSISHTVYSNEFSVFGCYMDELSLTCGNGGLINVTSAVYGQYASGCSECCVPDSINDCSELVVDNQLEEWIRLKYQCDNQTSCSFQYTGMVINDCGAEYVADYMHVFYDCTPGQVEDPVGFTACTSSTLDYTDGDVIQFDSIISNFGEHYNPANYVFTAPYNGIYMFSVNYNTDDGDSMVVEIRRDDVFIAEAWADDDVVLHSHASVFIVIDCNAGQTVWAQAGWSGPVYGSSQRSQFSGFMLHRFY